MSKRSPVPEFIRTAIPQSAEGAAVRLAFGQVAAREWEEIACRFADGTHEQSGIYTGQVWGHDRLSHFVMRWNGNIVAAAQVILLRFPVLERGLAYVKFGPLWRLKGQPADNAILRAVLLALKEEYVRKRGHCLTVLPPPDPDFVDLWEWVLDECGFVQRRPMSDPNRYMVDLGLDREAQRASLSQKWRYNLKKSARNGIEIVAGREAAHFSSFCKLYDQMLARKAFTDNNGHLAVPRMIQEMPEPARPEILIGLHDGEPTVGAIICRIGDVASYLYGATDARALGLRAGYALQWDIVERQRQNGARWYDLGGEANEPGLKQFKKGLVGREGKIVSMPGEWDCWKGELSRMTADAMYALRAGRAAFRRSKFARKAK